MSRLKERYIYIPVGQPVPQDVFVVDRITIPKTRKWVRYDMQRDLIDVKSIFSPGIHPEYVMGPVDITIEVKDREQDEWRRANLEELGFTKTPRNLIHALSLYGQDLPGEYYECQYIPLGDEHKVESLSEFIERSHRQEEELERVKGHLERLQSRIYSLMDEYTTIPEVGKIEPPYNQELDDYNYYSEDE